MEIVFLSFVFFLLFITVLILYIAIKVNHKFYWLAALLIYVFSYITAYLIGMFTVGFTFVALSLAVGYSFDWIKSKPSFFSFLSLGAVAGFLNVYYVRDYLFYPF